MAKGCLLASGRFIPWEVVQYEAIRGMTNRKKEGRKAPDHAALMAAGRRLYRKLCRLPGLTTNPRR